MARLGARGQASLSIGVEALPDALVVSLTGELDYSNSSELDEVLDRLTESHPARVVFELEGLRFIDSSGIALLVRTVPRVGTIAVLHPSSIVLRVLEATGLTDVLHVEPMVPTQDFPPDPASVALARAFITEALRAYPKDIVARAEVGVSELAANALRHAGTGFTVKHTATDAHLRIEVTDAGEGTPRKLNPKPLDPSGRGLLMVEALSDSWEVVPRQPTGKAVAFVLSLEPELHAP